MTVTNYCYGIPNGPNTSFKYVCGRLFAKHNIKGETN